MHLTFRNCNSAFVGLIEGIKSGAIPVETNASRNGEVLQIMQPMTITYERPRERVLFNQARDCNPFFHLYESLWMLTGRNDIEGLTYYTPTIKNYSDDGKTMNGAYGYRWRHAMIPDDKYEGRTFAVDFKIVDQLETIINHFKLNPESRRAVLNMWNVEDDLLKIGIGEGTTVSKDVCCNLSACFLIGKGPCSQCKGTGYVKSKLCTKCGGVEMSETNRYLDMTVFNRSNDLIWGMLGANVVHFSFLQEYMACCLGLDVGQYHQISNNLHIYTENNSGYKPDVWLAAHDTNEQYETAKVFNPIPLVQDKAVFDREVKLFVELNKNGSGLKGCELYKEPFLNNVAQPMMHAFHMHKQKDYDAAFHWVTRITQGDWKYAAATWLTKRKRIWENKNNPGQVTQGTDL